MTELTTKKRNDKRKAFKINQHGQVNEKRYIKSLGRTCIFVACSDGNRFSASCAPYVPKSMVSVYFNKTFDTVEDARDWLYKLYNKIADRRWDV